MPDAPTNDEPTNESEKPEAGEVQETDSTHEAEQKPDDEKPADEQVDADKGDEDKDDDSKLSHEDALAALKKVRQEAAESRKKRRELEDKLKDAKTPEEVAAITKQVAEDAAVEARSLLVENVALAHKLPPELADALKGESREELEAHAKVLAKFAPEVDEEIDPEKLRGGLDPSDTDDSFDPREAARANRKRRY